MANEGDTTTLTALLQTQTARAGPSGRPSLVVFFGPELGKRFYLDGPEQIIGRSESVSIQVDEGSVSRRHALLSVGDQGTRLRDLGSTNGTFVNDVRVEECALCDGDMLRVGKMVFKYFSGTGIEVEHHEALYRLSTTDALTGTFNRSHFLKVLDREWTRAVRSGHLLSLAMFDIDRFKTINDRFGHLAGDQVLRELPSMVAGSIRQGHILARYGGDEFALILPETDRRGARRLCETVRATVASRPVLFAEIELQVTISLGIRTTARHEGVGDCNTLIAEADARLYQAKRKGRNRVCW
jgi:diguanylate cyclase (GGDEF)-like protein